MTPSEYVVGERVEPHLTYEDYCALPEDGRRYQLIEGDLDVTLAPSATHQRVSRNLEFFLTARFGVRECWLVDPEALSFEIFKLAGSAYLLAQAASGKETATSELFPGLTLALDQIFAPDP
jgi:hypothetical protein